MATTPTQPRTPTYRLYIDESGDHAYSKLHEPGSRYLALLGVWFKRPEPYTAFAKGLEKLKQDIFGPPIAGKPIIFHRKEIMQRRGVFGYLNDEKTRRKFDNRLLKLIADTPFKVVCVVLDKQTHLTRYNEPLHPYHYCMTAMLERYCGWLDRFGRGRGDVVAETRGKVEDLQLRLAYSGIYATGTDNHEAAQLQRVLLDNEITICAKDQNVAGLQLADLLAQPIRQDCIRRKGLCEECGPSFGTKLCEIAETKLNRQIYQNRIDGYGRVWLSPPGF